MTRLVVAGAGAIGRRHVAHIVGHADVSLAAIIDPDRSAQSLADVPWFPDLTACTVGADGIVIATPTQSHAEVLAAGAQRGWHALVEKPLATTLNEIDGMIATAAAADIHILTGHHRRHHPTVAALRTALNEGVIGQPILASCIWSVRKPAGYFDVPWRQGADGAPVRMNLSHELDLLRFIFGEVTQHAAMGTNPVRQTPRVESGGVVLAFDSGVIATVAFADTTPSPFGFEHGTGENPNIAHTGQDSLRITGTEGAIAFPSLTVWSGASDWGTAPTANTLPTPPTKAPLDAQLSHFADVIAGRANPINDALSGRATHALTLAIEADCLDHMHGRTP